MKIVSENELIESNTGLVITLAKSFKPKDQNELDEYIQVGRIGLLKAIRKYEPSKGMLSTIAWKHIRWEIIRHIEKEKKFLAKSYPLIDSLPDVEYKTPLWEILPLNLNNKEQKILELRLQGHTFKEIGDKLGGYTRGWANKLFKSALQKIRTANEEKAHSIF